MKTDISLPDAVFQEAEAVAQQLGLSRSELYAEALKSYLQHYKQEQTKLELLDSYTQEVGDLDSAIASLHLMSLPRQIW